MIQLGKTYQMFNSWVLSFQLAHLPLSYTLGRRWATPRSPEERRDHQLPEQRSPGAQLTFEAMVHPAGSWNPKLTMVTSCTSKEHSTRIPRPTASALVLVSSPGHPKHPNAVPVAVTTSAVTPGHRKTQATPQTVEGPSRSLF